MLGLFRICAGEPGGRHILEQALDILIAQGNELRAAESNLLLGIAALADGDLTSAERRFGTAADVYGAAGDHARLTACRGCLCLLRIETGDRASARAMWAGAQVVVAGQLQGMQEEAGWLWVAMLLAEAYGQQHAALRLLGAIEAWDRRGVRFLEPLRRRYQPVADRLVEQAGPGASAPLMAEGAAMSPAELAALALAAVGSAAG